MAVMSDLLQLVYASKSNFENMSAVGGMHPEVQEILQQSRRNNELKNIGGMLCYGDGYFFQCLEGSRSAVERLYDRILQDDRHRDVTLLAKRPVQNRMFQLWNMKFLNVDRRIRRLLKVDSLEAFTPHQFSDLLVDRMLEEMRDAAENRPPMPLSRQRTGTGARQAGATRELMPGLMFATTAGVIAILAGFMLAGLL